MSQTDKAISAVTSAGWAVGSTVACASVTPVAFVHSTFEFVTIVVLSLMAGISAACSTFIVCYAIREILKEVREVYGSK